MTSAREIDDARAERLLRTRGHGAHLQGDAAGLFVAAVADLGQAAPAPTGALAALLTDGFVPGDTSAAAPAPGGPRRRHTDRRSRRPLLVRLLTGVTLVVGFGTAASAGVLPDPLQDKVGGLLEVTTPFEFPRSNEPAPVPTPGDRPAGKTAPTPTATPSGPPDSGPAAVEPVGPPPAAPPPGLERFPGQTPSTPATPTPSAAPQPPAREADPDEGPDQQDDPPRRETPGRTPAPTPAPAAERPASQGERPASQGERPAAGPFFPRATGSETQPAPRAGANIPD